MSAVTAAPSVPGQHAAWRATGPALAGAVVVMSCVGTWLAAGPGGRGLGLLVDDNVLTNAVNGVQLGVLGGLLLLLRPRNGVGWLLLYAAAANALSIFGEGWALASFALPLPGRTAMAWVGSWVWVTALLLGPTVLPAIYPDGRAASRFARWVVRLGWTASLVLGACLSLLDAPFRAVAPGHDLGGNPLSRGALQPFFLGTAVAAGVAGALLVVATLLWTVHRLRVAASPQREQLAWLLVGVVPPIVTALTAAPPAVGFAVNLLSNAALVLGIVRHGLFDIKLVLHSGLVYGLLIALTLVGYVAVVGSVTALAPDGLPARLVAAAAVALLAVPAYRWLTTAVGRFVYGDRADPVRALDRLGRRLDVAEGDGLAALVDSVADSLRSPYVALRTPGGLSVAAGTAGANPLHTVPLRHAGSEVGTLEVAWRRPGEPPDAADRRLLDALAAPVAAAVRAAVLAEEVVVAQTRVLAVREDERRRLRHDLHDGLGPSLAGVALGIEAARRTGDAGEARTILGVLQSEVDTLVEEVRHLIDDLGPAGLERGGLVPALRAQAAALGLLGDVRTVVQVPADRLPTMPYSVEVALHRVASEAFINVVRHAHATQARLVLERTAEGVRLLVEDDGVGLRAAPPGVGRSSMAERIGALGGLLTVTDRPDGGTRVEAHLPVAGEHLPPVADLTVVGEAG